ncbi:MAG: acetyltransferase [Pirellulaceae bacterium]
METESEFPPKRFAIIGFGGHGRVVAAALRAAGHRVVVATDHSPRDHRSKQPFAILSDEDFLRKYRPQDVQLVLGVGSVLPHETDSPSFRIVQKFHELGFEFVGLCHPAAWVAPDADIASTAQIHAGAVVQPGAQIGEFTVVNTSASVDHDCVVGDFCHLAPGSTLSGEVSLGERSHIGTGACIIQGTRIGEQCLVAAGATVVQDIPSGIWVKGTPAKPYQRKT